MGGGCISAVPAAQTFREHGRCRRFRHRTATAVEKLGADCVWLLDDDTVPSSSALMELVQVRQQLDRPPPLVASRVVWTDGGVHPMNTPRHVPWLGSPPLVPGLRLLRSASFVSVLIDGDAARSTAPPVADFFLWNDDFEYTTRLTRTSRGLLCEPRAPCR